MHYTEICRTMVTLLTEEPDLQKTVDYLNEEKDSELIISLATALVNLSTVMLSDLVRITPIIGKHVHVIICEVNDQVLGSMITKGQLGDSTLLSPATCNCDDDCYTIILTEKLSNRDRVGKTHIMMIYSIISSEYDGYIQSTFCPAIPPEQNMVATAYKYSSAYIPIGIMMESEMEFIAEESSVITVKAISEFMEYCKLMKEDEYWATILFDRGSICTAPDLGFQNILFLENDDLNDDFEIEDDYDMDDSDEDIPELDDDFDEFMKNAPTEEELNKRIMEAWGEGDNHSFDEDGNLIDDPDYDPLERISDPDDTEY